MLRAAVLTATVCVALLAGVDAFKASKKWAKGMKSFHKHLVLNGAEKKALLDQHNKLRAKIKAVNMAELVWNNDLAVGAQKHADACLAKHLHKWKVHGIQSGQNLYFSTSPINQKNAIGMFRRMVSDWFNEYRVYKCVGHKFCSKGTCQKGKKCGHYTQVAWAKSSRVGCALSQCQQLYWDTGRKPWKNAYYLVCYYEPPGNYVGQNAFGSSGGRKRPCSRCAKIQTKRGYYCDKGGLCASCEPRSHKGCVCRKKCKNGGVLNKGQCRCKCKGGKGGDFCEKSCSCKDTGKPVVCRKFKSQCRKGKYKVFMQKSCLKTCGMCRSKFKKPSNC